MVAIAIAPLFLLLRSLPFVRVGPFCCVLAQCVELAHVAMSDETTDPKPHDNSASSDIPAAVELATQTVSDITAAHGGISASCLQSQSVEGSAPGSDAVAVDDHERAPGPATDLVNVQTGAKPIRLQIEAFGSGVVLHSGLDVAPDLTVRDLKSLVVSCTLLPPRTRTVRLFLGHGGTELTDDSTLLSSFPKVLECNCTPLVVFPIVCTWCTRRCCAQR
mgnify:CR=1 FL=1